MENKKGGKMYMMCLSPTLVNDLQSIADDSNETLESTIFSALTLYVQLCEEVKKGSRIGAFNEKEEILLEYEGFYK